MADSATVTEPTYGVPEHAAALHVIVVDGAAVSGGAWITCVCTASTFPAKSHERYFTVVELLEPLTVNAPV